MARHIISVIIVCLKIHSIWPITCTYYLYYTLVSLLWDIFKQYWSRSDASDEASAQGHYCSWQNPLNLTLIEMYLYLYLLLFWCPYCGTSSNSVYTTHTHIYLYIYTHIHIHKLAGPRSAVGNVFDYRCVSDCRSRGCEFDPGPVPYFRGDWSWYDFYGHSPPFRWFIQEGLLSVTSESMCTNYWLTACSSLPRKKCG